MPELRLVVLATQDRLAFGTSFPEALANLFGKAAGGENAPAPGEAAKATPQQPAPSARTTAELIDQAAAEFNDYQRLTSEGKLGEAGQKLEALKRTLEELQKSKQ
jgi:uncharacterized membrane protein (UPF0182 family)